MLCMSTRTGSLAEFLRWFLYRISQILCRWRLHPEKLEKPEFLKIFRFIVNSTCQSCFILTTIPGFQFVLTSIVTFESSFVEGANILRNFSLKFWIFSCLLLRSRNSLSLSSITRREHSSQIYIKSAILENKTLTKAKQNVNNRFGAVMKAKFFCGSIGSTVSNHEIQRHRDLK